MINVNEELNAQENFSILLECHDNGKNFFFCYGVPILLCSSKFLTIIGDRPIILYDDSAKLQIRGVCINTEWFIQVRVIIDCISTDDSLHLIKSSLSSFIPFNFFSSSHLGKRRKFMQATQPYGLVMADSTNERSDISVTPGSIHLQDNINSFF